MSNNVADAVAKKNVDESKVGSYTLPSAAGRAENAEQFNSFRRQELLELFEKNLYGKIPPPPEKFEVVVKEDHHGALGGIAIRRQLDLRCTMPDGAVAVLPMLLYLPEDKTNVPCFFGLNFKSNADTTDEVEVPMAVLPEFSDGKPFALPPYNGSEEKNLSRWNFSEVVKRGYASATIWYGDLFPDRDIGFDISILSHFMTQEQWDSPERGTGAVSAWAWGILRAVDALLLQPEIDGSRIIVHGHSRLGKTSLWAAANDPRIAMAISNCSGCCGAALHRRNFGENIDIITLVFPHWFVPRLNEYRERESELPLDQHMLMSLIAPRPLAVGSATEDLHADPRGEFLAAQAASDVYRLFGRKGIPENAVMPEPDTALDCDGVSYHIRTGKHNITLEDWLVYMDFADRELKYSK